MVGWFCTICYHEQETEKDMPESCVKCGAGSGASFAINGRGVAAFELKSTGNMLNSLG